jgi:hypothetical protein
VALALLRAHLGTPARLPICPWQCCWGNPLLHLLQSTERHGWCRPVQPSLRDAGRRFSGLPCCRCCCLLLLWQYPSVARTPCAVRTGTLSGGLSDAARGVHRPGMARSCVRVAWTCCCRLQPAGWKLINIQAFTVDTRACSAASGQQILRICCLEVRSCVARKLVQAWLCGVGCSTS